MFCGSHKRRGSATRAPCERLAAAGACKRNIQGDVERGGHQATRAAGDGQASGPCATIKVCCRMVMSSYLLGGLAADRRRV